MTHHDRKSREMEAIKRIVLTGGAGFIGCHLTEALARNYPGAEIVVLDAMTYAVQPQAIDRLNQLFNVALGARRCL